MSLARFVAAPMPVTPRAPLASCWRVTASFRVAGAPFLPTLRLESEREAELEQAEAMPYQGGRVHNARFELAPNVRPGRGSDGFVYRCHIIAGEHVETGAELQATKSRGRYTWTLRGFGVPLPRNMLSDAIPEAQRIDEAARLPILSWALRPV